MKAEHAITWNTVGVITSLAVALVAGTFIGTNFVNEVKASNVRLETTLTLDFNQVEREQKAQDRHIEKVDETQSIIARNLAVDTVILERLTGETIPQESLNPKGP
jgi:hypothetical protein